MNTAKVAVAEARLQFISELEREFQGLNMDARFDAVHQWRLFWLRLEEMRRDAERTIRQETHPEEERPLPTREEAMAFFDRAQSYPPGLYEDRPDYVEQE